MRSLRVQKREIRVGEHRQYFLLQSLGKYQCKALESFRDIVLFCWKLKKILHGRLNKIIIKKLCDVEITSCSRAISSA